MFKEVSFVFAFDGHTLYLTPLSDQKDAARSLTMTRYSTGCWASPGDPIYIESKYLVLNPSNIPTRLVVFPSSDQFYPLVDMCGSMEVGVYMYFSMQPGSHSVSCIDFSSPFLNRSYDVLDILGTTDFDEVTRTLTLTTRSVESVRCEVSLCSTQTEVSIFYNLSSRDRESHQPLAVSSVMRFKFEPTSDYELVGNLVGIANSYLCFITQTRNMVFENVRLREVRPLESEEAGELTTKYYSVRLGDVVINGQDIGANVVGKQRLLLPIGAGCELERRVLQALADGWLITRHLVPIDRTNDYDYPRCVMLAASFDSTFNVLYPDGVRHHQAKVDAVEYISGVLMDIENDGDATKTRGDTARWLRGILVDGDSFSSKLVQFWKDHEKLIRSYSLGAYAEQKRYAEFSERMQRMRNALAHGRIDISADKQLLLDVQFLERIVLWCQLLALGLDDDSVQDVMGRATSNR